MKRYDLITPEGTRDLLFEEAFARRTVEKKIKELFVRFGYSEVVTPGLEFFDAFSGSTRNFRTENLYKTFDSKGRIIVMRPDSTIPIARLVATRLKNAVMPLRLYYNQRIYENNALLKGRSDETVQAGIELIGSPNKKRADHEVLCIAIEALSMFDKDNYRLELGHIGYFKELVGRLGADDDTKEEIRMLISQKNYPALNDLLSTFGDNEVTRALRQLPRLFGGREVFEKAAAVYTDDNISSILDELRAQYERLASLGYEDKISLDLGIVSHTDYYTGVVFKGYLSEVGKYVLNGGRYDNLISEFGLDSPAVGFGVDVDAVVRHLNRIGVTFEPNPPAVLVHADEGYGVEGFNYVKELSENGLIVEYSLFDTFEQAQEYAKKKGIGEVIRIGKDNTDK